MQRKIPEPGRQTFLAEGGIETYMQYKKGHELKHFCLFDLMNDKRAMADLRTYHVQLIEVALKHKVGAVLDGVHYRTSSDWGAKLGYSASALTEIVIRGIEFYKELAREYETEESPMPVSGVVGPRGDAYNIGRRMEAEEAAEYHAEQIATMKAAGADFITALTLSQVDEAIGVTRAAIGQDMPVVVSFALNKDGRLKTGTPLGDAIKSVDRATGNGPRYYMVNCTHPVDFAPAFEDPGAWITRVCGLRANASSLDHGTLCQLGHLEEGDPEELGRQMADMARRYPHINVWGGCCGTDHVHIGKIASAVVPVRQEAMKILPVA
ncbi:MAG: homocysteine S-methyltransferase family protein [Hyphomicrobiales bacterium]|nr:homocysteine S-methyltransferase family protein [Hyphomicrobiales bacterium]MCP4998873.1 homocysteine S-methyltransferase family protein [Hyphomicrobiales bacterium]